MTSKPTAVRGLFSIFSRLIRGSTPLFAVVQSVAAQISVLGINLITGVLVARLLGPESRGILSAVSVWPQLVASLAISGIGSATVYFLRKPEEGSSALIPLALLLFISNSAFILVASAVVPVLMHDYERAVIIPTLFVLLFSYVSSAQIFVKYAAAGLGSFWIFNLANIIPQLLYLAFLVLYAITVGLTWPTALISLLAGAIAALAVTLVLTRHQLMPLLRKRWSSFVPIRQFSLRAAPSDIVGVLSSTLDRMLLIPFVKPSELGLYVVTLSLSRVVQLVLPAVASVFMSTLVSRSPVERKELHDRALRIALPSLTALGALVCLSGSTLLSFLFGSEFSSGAPILRILTIEAVIACLAQVTGQLFIAMGKPAVFSFCAVSGFGTFLSSGLLLAPTHGAIGVAWALLAGSAVRLVFLTICIPLKLRMRLSLPVPRRSDLHYLLQQIRRDTSVKDSSGDGIL